MRLAALLLPLLCFAEPPLEPAADRALEGETIAGAASLNDGATFITWGTALRRWSLPSLETTVLATGPFGEGGCAVDLDRDGAREAVTVRGGGLGTLVRLAPPHWQPESIDTGIEMHDCMEATLFGRRGVLMIQRGMQVRFYERRVDGGWTSRDIYSIYTPSYQGGLALADVDRDGFPDIFCGNYWIRSPRRFELPWRLFAINTWTEAADSATFRLAAMTGGRLAAAQAHASPARIAVFAKPRDPKLQWAARRVETGAPFTRVHGLALWQGKLLAGENSGPASRLMSIDPETAALEVIATGRPIVAILPAGPDAFVTAGPGYVALWRHSSRR